MFLHIEDSEECIRVAFVPVYFDGGAEERLREYQFCERRDIEEGTVNIKELPEERLQSVEVVSGLGVEHFEIDVDCVQVLDSLN